MNRPIGQVVVWTALCVMTLAVAAPADQVKIAGYWVEEVIVSGIADGQLFYTTSAGADAQRGLDQIEGLRLDRQKASTAAQEALDAGDHEAAAEALRQWYDNAHQPWAKHWAGYQLGQVQDRLGDAESATRVYLDMVSEKADAFLLQKPPLESLLKADDEQKQNIAEHADLLGVEPGDDEVGKLVKQVLDLTIVIEPDDGDDTAGDHDAMTAPRADDAVLPDAAAAARAAAQAAAQRARAHINKNRLVGDPAIVMSTQLDPKDKITRALWNGKFDEALTMANQALRGDTAGRMSRLLYKRGLAQLGLAEKSGDLKMYKTAGISFLRVVIYYPRSTTWRGPSWMEAGYVHQKIGRHDIANRLFDTASNDIDAAEEPALAKRLEQLQSQSE